jgi:hypothetical protein
MVLGAYDGSVRLYDHASGALVASASAEGMVVDLKFSPDGRWLAFAGGKTVRVWDVPARRLLDREFPHPNPVLAVNFDPAGTRLATLCESDSHGRIFALAPDAQEGPIEFPHRLLWHPGDSTVGRPFAPVFILDPSRHAVARGAGAQGRARLGTDHPRRRPRLQPDRRRMDRPLAPLRARTGGRPARASRTGGERRLDAI